MEKLSFFISELNSVNQVYKTIIGLLLCFIISLIFIIRGCNLLRKGREKRIQYYSDINMIRSRHVMKINENDDDINGKSEQAGGIFVISFGISLIFIGISFWLIHRHVVSVFIDLLIIAFFWGLSRLATRLITRKLDI